MRQSTPNNEPEYVTRLRRETYENWLNAGSFLFLAPVVSQAAACDGTTITTTAEVQEIAHGTLAEILTLETTKHLAELGLILFSYPNILSCNINIL